jgi:hypothetical protein
MKTSYYENGRDRTNGATSLTMRSLLDMEMAPKPRHAPPREEPSEDAITLRIPKIVGPLAVLACVSIAALTAMHLSPVHYRVGLTNTTERPLHSLVMRMGGESVSLGDLAPGASVSHTFVRSSRPGAVDVSTVVDGKPRALGQCPVIGSERSQTRIVVRGPALDDARDCMPDAPRRVGWLP